MKSQAKTILRKPKYQLQFSLFYLLAVTTLAAVGFSILRAFDPTNWSFIFLIALLLSCGYVAGWLTRPDSSVSLFFPAIAFSVFNGLLWYSNRISLYFVEQSSNMLAAGLEGMLDANKLYVFDMVTVTFSVTMLLAAYRKNRNIVFRVGVTSVAFWLLVAMLGYFTAAASLWEMQGLAFTSQSAKYADLVSIVLR